MILPFNNVPVQFVKKRIDDNAEKVLLTLLTGVSLFFVLYIYKAYNIQQGVSLSGHGLLFRAIVFGLFTSLSFFVNEFYIAGWFTLNTTWRKVAWTAWEVFMGANVTFLLFNYFWNWTEFDWPGYGLMLFEYACVMVFPLLFVKVMARQSSRNKPTEHGKLVFKAGNGKHSLSIKSEYFLYIKSEDNYIEIYYVSDGKVKCELLRNSMKAIEEEFADSPYLARCHRSYMVNPGQVNQTIVNSRQTQLELGYAISIPVSQKYNEQFNPAKVPADSPHL